MPSPTFTLTWLGALVASAAALASSAPKSNIVPGVYIAEFEDSVSTTAFYSNLTKSKIDATPRVTLDHQLFNGASFKLADAHDTADTVGTIQSMAIVKQVWPMRTYSHLGNADAAARGLASSLATQGKRHTEAAEDVEKRAAADTWSTHVMGGVSGLRDQGFSGEGIFVGVVDTGVDWSHPALGGCFGPGCKVVTGYDLVGPNYNGQNTPVPGPGVTDCQGHGTHVSGIIAANPNPFNFTGVIPDATLGMWKVFSCVDSVGDDVLITAFNAAYEAGVDVISCSIGGSSGWTESSWDVAVQRIVAKGTPCIIAAGNDGINGMFDTSEASEGIGAVSVGSVDNTLWPAFLTEAHYLVDGGDETEFGYAASGAAHDFGTVSLPMYAVSFDTTDPAQACSPLPSTTPNLSGYIVLIRRGTCAFDTKIANAVAFGATKILFYNNVPGEPTQPGDTSTTVPVGQVSNVLGAHFVSLLAAGDTVTVEFVTASEAEITFEMPVNTVTPGKMSTYTSWGPTYEMYVKPQVSAPGGYILSTWPLDLANPPYAAISGTSMATPFIAGVVGLLKQVKGKSISPKLIEILLSTTATPITWNDGSATNYTYLAPVIQQGGGLVNAFKAAYATTLLDTSVIALNDTTHFTAAHSVSITNAGNTAVSYTFANIGAATGYTLASGSVFPSTFPPALDTSSASIRFVPSTLTVPAGATLPVVLHFTRPDDDESRIPVYSGYVGITGSNGDYLTLPYAGVDSELKDATVTDYPDGFPYLASSADPNLDPITAPTTFVMDGSGYPTIVWLLAMGSPIVRVDIVPQDPTGLPRIIGQQALGSMAGYPATDAPRNELISSPWDGTLDDGTVVPAGTYKFLYRALKIFGDPTYDHDYEAYSTPYFTIKY